ncbi:MAG: hypothetical protein U0931_01515 [Vulcanimicrobiota bacterium]
MSSQIKKFTLAAAAVLTLTYLVGCGTKGENTGFGNKVTGPGLGLGSGSSTTTTTTTGGLTGGTSGTATVNDAFPITTATGLTVSSMLATSGGSGNSNPPTRLAFGTFSALGTGRRVAVVQGLGVATGGRVVIMPRSPETVAGTSNVVLNPTGAGSDAAGQALTNPFGILVEGETIFITDQSTSPTLGRIMMYDQIQASGVCRGRAINCTPPLANPVKIVKDGNFLFVAENQPRGGGGRIRKIDLTKAFTDPANDSFILIDNVNNPVSLALDKFSGRNFLYIAENGAGSASGAQGGIARVDLSQAPFNLTAGPGTGKLTATAADNVALAGVQFIDPGTTAWNFPFDIALDNFGNLVTTEGVSVAASGLVNPNFTTGRIRVVQGTATGGAPATAAKVVLQNAAPGTSVGVTGSRGVSLKNEDGSGLVVSAFFTEGVALATTLRQLTFRTSDAAIFRHIQLDSGKLAPLDTLFDSGDSSSTPVVAPNVKYTIGSFGGGTNGQVLDIR